MDAMLLGETKTFTVQLKRDGSPIAFVTPPVWALRNSEDLVVANGNTVSLGGGRWRADVTVPIDYQITDGMATEEMWLEVYGKDAANHTRSVDLYFEVAVGADDFVPDGTIVFPNAPVYDYLVVDYPPTNTSVVIMNAAGQTSYTATLNPTSIDRVRGVRSTPDRMFDGESTQDYYKLTYDLSGLTLGESTRPYIAQYTLTVKGKTRNEFRVLFNVTPMMLSQIMTLRSFLDKARLVEIDRTLQWTDEELAASLYEGLAMINGYQPVTTSWKFTELPQPLFLHWNYASAIYLLNARYMAEGFNSFEFSGLNTTLAVDRRETLSYKIDELKGFLSENLPAVKRSAAQSFGTGSVDPTVTGAVSRSQLGVVGLVIGPNNNAVNMNTFNRLNRFRAIA